MAEILSPEEISQLLAEVDAMNAAEEAGGYDGEDRVEKFTREQLRAIALVHEKFTRLAAASLSAQVGGNVQITVASVDQVTMGEFSRTIPVPTTLGVINIDPLGGAILEIDPAVTFAIIDRIRGGRTKSQHELTDAEKIIMQDVYAGLLENLREAWAAVTDVYPRLDRIEADPQYIKLVPPAEMTALITLEARIGKTEGMLNLCIPYPVIELVIGKF